MFRKRYEKGLFIILEFLLFHTIKKMNLWQKWYEGEMGKERQRMSQGGGIKNIKMFET